MKCLKKLAGEMIKTISVKWQKKEVVVVAAGARSRMAAQGWEAQPIERESRVFLNCLA